MHKTKSQPLELNLDMAPAHMVLIRHRTANVIEIQRREGQGEAGLGPEKSEVCSWSWKKG